MDSWRLSALGGSESLHSSQTACMYAQYAHAAPSHTPYLDDTNFIAALRAKDKDKDKDKEKDRNKEMGKDKKKDKDKDKVRGRNGNNSEASRESYDISAQNDAREVLLYHFHSLLSYLFPSLLSRLLPYSPLISSCPFSLLILLVLCYATPTLIFLLYHKYHYFQSNSTLFLTLMCIVSASVHRIIRRNEY